MVNNSKMNASPNHMVSVAHLDLRYNLLPDV